MKFLAVILAGLFAAVGARGADPVAARLVLLANRDDPDSLRIARHYAEVRGVPADNVIALSLPSTETITWSEFVATLWTPLQDELMRRGWIEGIPMQLTDDVGRRKSAISGHRMSYLVVCRGVPLRIAHDPARYHPHPPITDNPYFQTNEGAVDSELSLLAVSESPINAFLLNPLFAKDHPSRIDLTRVVKVSRLDGPTADDANALVDRAVAAERSGLIGRAYIDLSDQRREGNQWLEDTAAQIADLGYDVAIDRARETMPATARCDAPALYFGWYAHDLTGPFALPGFRFPPGAIAIHIHSSSAETLRSTTVGWTGPLVARGVTATVGNVFEPYLQLLHRPDLLFRSLARGDRFGDAAYYAEPVLSWQAIAVGDPLYRPFTVPLDIQLQRRSAMSADDAAYVTLRAMRRQDAARHPTEAVALARVEQERRPTLELGLELAAEARRVERPGGVAEALGFAATRRDFPVGEWGLAAEVARTLRDAGSPHLASQVFEHLADASSMPVELRIGWLSDAREAAIQAGEMDRSAALNARLDELRGGTKK